jgi:hypothetical protein
MATIARGRQPRKFVSTVSVEPLIKFLTDAGQLHNTSITLRQLKRQKALTVWSADRIAIGLGTHPFLIWGMEFYEVTEQWLMWDDIGGELELVSTEKEDCRVDSERFDAGE